MLTARTTATLTFAGQCTLIYRPWAAISLILICFDFKDGMKWKDGGEVENGLVGGVVVYLNVFGLLSPSSNQESREKSLLV
jgi:hypothetical protein